MTHEYTTTTDEYVKISRENYDKIKDGYDSKVEDLGSIIDGLESDKKEMEDAVCVIEIYNRKIFNYATQAGTVINGGSEAYKTIPEDVKVFNGKSDLYEEIHKFFADQKTTQKMIEISHDRLISETLRITNFQNSLIGKFLNFFGVRV